MRISDWSSDVCSSDLPRGTPSAAIVEPMVARSQEGEHRLDKPPHETAISRIGGIVAVKPLLRLFCGRVGKVGPSHKRGLATRAPKIGFAIEHLKRSWRRASPHAAGGARPARANSRTGRATGQGE